MSSLSLSADQEELARAFCIKLAREFGVRARHFKPTTAQEHRWLQEGIRPVGQFETLGELS